MQSERYQRKEANFLGRGGMGVVYKAYDTLKECWVAQKIMTGFPDDPELDQKARERFEREVKFARKLQHTHLLSALDDGYTFYQDRQLPFMVTPYMLDGSLVRFMKRFPPCSTWSLVQTADVIFQAASGLQYMHNQNPPTVHQDIKPANLLIKHIGKSDRIAHIYISDFGITREQRSPSDVASEVIVSYFYMAPEQVDKVITPASDQYSLAVIACELLTSKLPFRAITDTGFVRAHLSNTPIPPSQLNPMRVKSSEIDEIILKALNKDPDKRFGSVREFADSLQHAIIRQSGPDSVTASYTVSSAETRIDDEIPVEEGPVAPLPSIEKQAFEPILLDPPTVLKQPDVAGQSQGPDDLPLTERAKAALVEQSFRPLLSQELPGRPIMISWSGDGEDALCAFFAHAPVLISRYGKSVTLGALGNVRAICRAPKSSLVAVSIPAATPDEARTLAQVWDINAATRPLFTLPFQTGGIEGMDWSNDQRLAIWVEQQILLYQLPEQIPVNYQPIATRTLATPQMRSGNVGTLRWSPDAAWLAAGAMNGAVTCWNARTLTRHLEIPASNQLVYSIAWSRDSKHLAIAFRDQRVEIWDVSRKKCVARWTQLSLVPRMLSVSVNNRLAIASNTDTLLFGNMAEKNPDGTFAGHWLAAWSPMRPEFATLDTRTGTDLLLLEEASR
jgi:serine/threonine protein kinase